MNVKKQNSKIQLATPTTPQSPSLLVNRKLVRRRDIILKVIIVVFGFMLYANTLGHGYALDDTVTIWKNEFTQAGFAGINDILSYDTMAGMFGKDIDEVGGGRYRPLSVIMFAIELELFGKTTEAPDFTGEIVSATFAGHFFNVLYYCLLLLLMYHVLCKLFRNYTAKHWLLSIPFLATMLFAMHPLHTEVVANIKGRDEIMAFLFSLLALNCGIEVLHTKGIKRLVHIIAIFGFIFLGSMSKENTVAFVFIIPLTLYFFYDTKISSCFKIAIPAFVGALLYVVIRGMIIKNQFGNEAGLLLNNPFLYMDAGEKYATVFYTLLLYLKLLVFPHPLTWDYYPYHIPTMQWSDWQPLLSLALHLGLVVVAVIYLLPRRKSVYSYSIFFYAATLILPSNLLFNVGAFMAERFMFMPSLGFSLAVAYFLSHDLPLLLANKQKVSVGIALSVLAVATICFSARTIVRNGDWKDSSTLFAHDVKVCPNSIKGNSSYASDLYTQSEGWEKKANATTGNDSLNFINKRDSVLTIAVPYFEKALQFDSLNSESLVRLGNIYYRTRGDHAAMFRYYKKALEGNPLHKDVWANAVGVLTYNLNDIEYEKSVWWDFARLSPKYYEAFYQLGEIYYNSQPKENDSAIYYLSKAYTLNRSKVEIVHHLGVAYGNIGDFSNAKTYLLKAYSLQKNAEICKFLGIIFGNEGNANEAYRYFSEAVSLNPDDALLQQYLELSRRQAGK